MGKHLGQTKHKLYHIWILIKARCYYEEHDNYKNYGGRGISVSDEFRNNSKAFIEYIESLPRYNEREELHLSLDRIENNGNYERGNLRWATSKEQSNNKRKGYTKRKKVKIIYVDDNTVNIIRW